MDSVDKRFMNVNQHLGNEYLRNIMLNSPILRIRPGMPRYTGAEDPSDLLNNLKQISKDSGGGGSSALTKLLKSTVFSSGSKLQKRMFGFYEDYEHYMEHVNYMCRAMAIFLNLTSDSDDAESFVYPNGCLTSDSPTERQPFLNIKWQNYRMIGDAKCKTPSEQLLAMGKATFLGPVVTSAGSAVSNTTEALAKTLGEILMDDHSMEDVYDIWFQSGKNIASDTNAAIKEDQENSVSGVVASKITSVSFMVDPTAFEESLTNETKESVVESTIDAVYNVGNEIAFITGSTKDPNMIKSMTEFLGNTAETAAQFVGGLTEPVAGGFVSNLFHGALSSIKGQKMIYPKIYSKSNSSMDYQFTVNLSSPYGDVYNYYMNIVVPLCHLICLVAPRMVTSNSVSSPYIVQAFIPGMCTCQLGIVKSMVIRKNPKANHVSVNGFPLDVQVTFQIEELYNALSISPVSDPASYLYNETLNDYMCNLAGLIPSEDTMQKERHGQDQILGNYFNSGEGLESAVYDLFTRPAEDLTYTY